MTKDASLLIFNALLVLSKVAPVKAVRITISVEDPDKASSKVPLAITLFVTVFTFPDSTVILPITRLAVVVKVTLETVSINISVVDPVKAVFNLPVIVPLPVVCVTVTPALSVMACAVMATVHIDCVTTTFLLALIV